jgi:glycosyltransferase involved in cell wall biosynthesis
MLGIRPVIVWNGPPRWDRPDPPRRLLHERAGLSRDTPVALQLGALQAHRGIEELIDAMALVPGVALVIIGDGPQQAALEQRAAAAAHGDRVHFLGFAAPDEILPLTAAADVAVMPVQGTTLNHRLNTPTKLFDAMGAGTPVVAADLPGMAAIVRETGCGVLCDATSPPDIARAIREVLDAPAGQRSAFGEAGLRAARTTYGWERQVETLLGVYGRLA